MLIKSTKIKTLLRQLGNQGDWIHLGPVVQSIISLTSSLEIKMLQVFLLKKCE